MPAGVLVMVPAPVPVTVTVSVADVGLLKVAVTEEFALRVRTHEPVPLHAPDQPAKVIPVVGVAVSVTTVPVVNVALHIAPQSMPLGLLLTVPVPVPARTTVRVSDVTVLLNVAMTNVLDVMVT